MSVSLLDRAAGNGHVAARPNVRIAVVGLGKMGLSHVSIIGTHPDVTLAAVVDSSSYVLEKLAP